MFSQYALPHGKNLDDFQVFVFDKDNTLTPPNAEIEPKMIDYLVSIMRRKVVVILTARDMEVCYKHIIDPIRAHVSARIFSIIQKKLIFACSNGSQIFSYNQEQKEYVLQSELPGELPSKEYFSQVIPKMAEAMDVDEKEMYFEPRSATMGAYVCIPRTSTQEQRKTFDPTKSKRQKVIEVMCENLPILSHKHNYEILPGGSTSIDVAVHDKKAGMEHLIQTLGYTAQCGKIIFFGDGFDGGNDTPVLGVEGITVVQVKNCENTADILSQWKMQRHPHGIHYKNERVKVWNVKKNYAKRNIVEKCLKCM